MARKGLHHFYSWTVPIVRSHRKEKKKNQEIFVVHATDTRIEVEGIPRCLRTQFHYLTQCHFLCIGHGSAQVSFDSR